MFESTCIRFTFVYHFQLCVKSGLAFPEIMNSVHIKTSHLKLMWFQNAHWEMPLLWWCNIMTPSGIRGTHVSTSTGVMVGLLNNSVFNKSSPYKLRLKLLIGFQEVWAYCILTYRKVFTARLNTHSCLVLFISSYLLQIQIYAFLV